MRKTISVHFMITTTICMFLVMTFFSLTVRAQEEGVSFQEKYEELKIQFSTLEKDRDNLLAQVKTLMEKQQGCTQSQEYLELEKDRDNILSQVQTLLKEKAKIKNFQAEVKKFTVYNEKLKNDKAVLLAKIDDLEEELKKQQERTFAESQKVETLKKTIETMKLEYKMVDELKEKLKSEERKTSLLDEEISKLKDSRKAMESEKLEAKAAAEVYRRQIGDLKGKYREALAANKALERQIEDVPKKFAEIGRENKTLIKETALMHYNLGVFYTERKEYRRAIAELEKALELNPDDAYAHFNLGYIYAEYIVDRKQAIEHFRHYLRLAKRGDKDIEWVKKYILTWQAWDVKRPLK